MQKIIPNLWFNHNAKEAVDFYISVFKDAKVISTEYYPKDGLADFQKEFAGKELVINFELFGQQFTAINAGPEFKPNEAVSFLVNCNDQDEIDYYWQQLTASGGEESVCGWCKDKFGFSWQIVPQNMDSLVNKPENFAKMMEMKKIIIADFK